MAIKTTIGPKGVVSEKIDGVVDKVVYDVDSKNEGVRTIVSGSGTVSVLGGANMFVAPQTVTASLPLLGVEEVGTRILLMNDLNGTSMLVTSSNSINGVTDPVEMSASYGVLDLIGVKSDNDGNFHWHILDATEPV